MDIFTGQLSDRRFHRMHVLPRWIVFLLPEDDLKSLHNLWYLCWGPGGVHVCANVSFLVVACRKTCCISVCVLMCNDYLDAFMIWLLSLFGLKDFQTTCGVQTQCERKKPNCAFMGGLAAHNVYFWAAVTVHFEKRISKKQIFSPKTNRR